MALYAHIGILVGAFIAVLGFYFVVMMDRLHITYTRLYGVTCAYFLLATGVVGYFNRSYFAQVLNTPKTMPFVVLLGAVAAALLLSHWARTHLERPDAFIGRNTHQTFICLDYRYLLSKACEILFQQSIVVLLALLLAEAGLSMTQIVWVFALVFGAAHLPLIFYDKRSWGWYYTAFSFVAGFIFPPLILGADFGFIYAFLIHWLFYALGGVAFWMYLSRGIIKK